MLLGAAITARMWGACLASPTTQLLALELNYYHIMAPPPPLPARALYRVFSFTTARL